MSVIPEGPASAPAAVALLPNDGARMHRFDAVTAELAEQTFAFIRRRLGGVDPVLNPAAAPESQEVLIGGAISRDGMGAAHAFSLLTEAILPGCVQVEDPRALAFVGAAPAHSATLADLALTASTVIADWWIQGGGAIHAENQALDWLVDIAGLPSGAGGVFLSGGTIANLSGLFVARHTWRRRSGSTGRGAIAATSEAHSSIRLAARVLDVDILTVPHDDRGRMTGEALEAAIDGYDGVVFAVAASVGCTNTGAIDELASIAPICRARDLWLHVDGAYGGAALASSTARPRFAGIEQADSLVVDPHKWLFAPVDCSALLYRDPTLARAANTQTADYLEPLDGLVDWNPSDYGIHMTRRARGLPLWFALATHGSDAFEAAIDACLDVAHDVARAVDLAPYLELILEPELSVVLFRRTGWQRAQYEAWSKRLLEAGIGYVTPTTWDGEPALRFCFVNPRSTLADVEPILVSLALDPL